MDSSFRRIMIYCCIDVVSTIYFAHAVSPVGNIFKRSGQLSHRAQYDFLRCNIKRIRMDFRYCNEPRAYFYSQYDALS